VLPGWHGVTGPDVEQALGVPVSIDNDANLAALGEHLWGAGRGCDDCVTVKFHYGIGCGLFVNGALVRGAAGGAGEIGHTTVDERGPLCRCGKRGCLDTYAAIPAILDALRPQHGPLTLAGLMALLTGRDPGAVRVVSDAAGLVGRQLAIACNLLAPRRVVVVGAMAEAGETVLGPLRAALRRDIAPNEPPELALGALGPRHTALGAIALALDESDWLPAVRPTGLPAQDELPGRVRQRLRRVLPVRELAHEFPLPFAVAGQVDHVRPGGPGGHADPPVGQRPAPRDGADYSSLSERVTVHPSRARRTGHAAPYTHPRPTGPPSRVVITRQMKPARTPAGSSGPSTDHQRTSDPCCSDAHVSRIAATMAAKTAPCPPPVRLPG
jgi:predicted NBD/HSP70 family sugar kinase